MGWGYVFMFWALWLGLQLLGPLLDLLGFPAGLAATIEVAYLLGTFVYIGWSLVWAARTLLGRRDRVLR